jgi:hypothetical protein
MTFRPTRELDVDAAVRLAQLFHALAQPDAATRRDGAFSENLMQSSATDSQIRRASRHEFRRRYPCAMDAVPTEDVDVIESETCIDIRGKDAELRHRPNHIGLLDDSDAIDRPRWVTLNNVDVKATLPQCDGSSQAANAPTND